MHLKGNFETSFLSSILQLLCNDGKTAVLRLTDESNEVKIFIRNGEVIYAVGSQKEARLGQLLISKGVINDQQLEECLNAAREEKQALGKVLVARKYVTPDKLNAIIQKQAEEVIFGLFLWNKGAFEYRDVDLNLKGMLVSPLNIMNIILEASRRIDEMSILTKRIPSDRVVLKISEKVQEKQEIKFKAKEWRMLTLIDGQRSVRRLIDESGYDDFAVYKVLYSLISYGVVEQSEEAEIVETAQAEYAAIIRLCQTILAPVYKMLKAEMEQWPYLPLEAVPPDRLKSMRAAALQECLAAIFKGARPAADPVQDRIYFKLYAGTAADEILSDLPAVLPEIKDAAEGCQFLYDSFIPLMDNLLGQMPKILGLETTRRLLTLVGTIIGAGPATAAVGGLIAALEPVLERIERYAEADRSLSLVRPTVLVFDSRLQG